MNKETLIAAGEAAFGKHFVSEMAERLSVSDRTVRHWISGKYQTPSTLSADIVLILEKRKKEIDEAIAMTIETFLMNPFTGSVDTIENWRAEMYEWDENPAECERQFNTLVEVVKNDSGAWVKI